MSITDTLPTVEQTYREKQIQKLRDYADFCETHPEASTYLSAGEVYHYCEDAEDMAQMARALGGRWSKRTNDWSFFLEQEVVPGVVYKLQADRGGVCERVVVGQKPVEVPDPEYLAAAPKVTTMVDEVEWRCPDSLLEMTKGEGGSA